MKNYKTSLYSLPSEQVICYLFRDIITTAILKVKIPSGYTLESNDELLEQYLNNALIDYVEAQEDIVLKDKLSKNQKWVKGTGSIVEIKYDLFFLISYIS